MVGKWLSYENIFHLFLYANIQMIIAKLNSLAYNKYYRIMSFFHMIRVAISNFSTIESGTPDLSSWHNPITHLILLAMAMKSQNEIFDSSSPYLFTATPNIFPGILTCISCKAESSSKGVDRPSSECFLKTCNNCFLFQWKFYLFNWLR